MPQYIVTKINFFGFSLTMNNICDLTDDTEGSQLSHLTLEQKQELKTLIKSVPVTNPGFNDNIKKGFRNVRSIYFYIIERSLFRY